VIFIFPPYHILTLPAVYVVASEIHFILTLPCLQEVYLVASELHFLLQARIARVPPSITLHKLSSSSPAISPHHELCALLALTLRLCYDLGTGDIVSREVLREMGVGSGRALPCLPPPPPCWLQWALERLEVLEAVQGPLAAADAEVLQAQYCP
jgi:hypothetical protein